MIEIFAGLRSRARRGAGRDPAPRDSRRNSATAPNMSRLSRRSTFRPVDCQSGSGWYYVETSESARVSGGGGVAAEHEDIRRCLVLRRRDAGRVRRPPLRRCEDNHRIAVVVHQAGSPNVRRLDGQDECGSESSKDVRTCFVIMPFGMKTAEDRKTRIDFNRDLHAHHQARRREPSGRTDQHQMRPL